MDFGVLCGIKTKTKFPNLQMRCFEEEKKNAALKFSSWKNAFDGIVLIRRFLFIFENQDHRG